MEELRPKASLTDIQVYVEQMERERGFSDQSALQKCLLLGEEVGELFKAVRKHEGLPIEHSGATLSLAGELADVIIYLCAIANRYEIDLDTAFREKERLNASRSWASAKDPS